MSIYTTSFLSVVTSEVASTVLIVCPRVIRMVIVSRDVLGSVVRLGMTVVAFIVEMASVVCNILMVAVLCFSMLPPSRVAVLATARGVDVDSTVMRITGVTIE